jgi:hypothetical protein
MAIAESTLAALDAVAESVLEAQTLVESYMELVGDRPSPVVYAFSAQMHRLCSRAEALEKHLRQSVLPLLADFGRVQGGA